MPLNEVAYHVFLTVVPIFLITLIGYGYGKKTDSDIEFANRANLDLFTPMLILDALAVKQIEIASYGYLALSGVLIVLGSGVLAALLARYFNFPMKVFVPPMMFNNSGNLGIPLLVLALGESMLPAAVLLFVLEAILHVTVGIFMLDRNTSLLGMIRLPIVLAALLGLVLGQTGFDIPEVLAIPISMLGQIAVPLMLVTLGIRIAQSGLTVSHMGRVGAWVSPATGIVIALTCQLLFHLPAIQFAAIVLFGALPPAVMNYIIAEKYQVAPGEVASIVMGGNLASLVFIPLTLGILLYTGVV